MTSVVADIEFVFIGTSFFQEKFKIFTIQDFNLSFKHSFKDQSTTGSFTTLKEKIFPCFFVNYQINLKKPN